MAYYDLERENLNNKMNEQRIKEDMARRANRAKQAVFKENMRLKGYRQKNVWIKDPPEGMSETSSVLIHNGTKGIADRNIEIGEKLKSAIGDLAFNEKIIDYDLYSDIMLLLNPLGKIFQTSPCLENSGYEPENA